MSDVLKILFVAALTNGLFAIYSTLLTSIGYEKHTSVMILLSVVLNVILNLVFVPTYGINASAWATVLSTVFLSFTYAYYLHKKDIITIPFAVIFKLCLVFVLFMSLYYGLTFTGLEWYMTTAIAGLFLAALSWILGLLNFKEVVSES
jgi:O-antigen/teichoic acid export membrane protein